MKKVLSIILALTMLISVFSSFAITANAATTKIVERDGVMQMGDFESMTSGYIIYFPKDLQSSNKAYPVAVWANGTMCPPALYEGMFAGLAKAGYIVVASPELMSKDGKAQCAAIDYILDESLDENSPFYGKVDPNKIGAFGHSQGGASSVNAAVQDDRIGAIVSIAGASSKSEAKDLKAPTLFLTGTADAIVMSSLWVKPSFDACQGPAVYASLNKGVHVSCTVVPDTYTNYIVKWFNAWLDEDGDLSPFTSGGELSKDTAWKDYKAKNMNTNMAGSVFVDGGNIWALVSIAEFIIIIGLAIILVKKKNDKKEAK